MTRVFAVQRSRRAFARAASVLLLLAGLIGMHGLANHQQHVAAKGTVGRTLLAAPQGQAHGLAVGRHTPATTPLPTVTSDATLTPSEHCGDSCVESLAALCVALLTATSLLVLVSQRLRRHHPAPVPLGRTRVCSAPVRGPPDVVGLLCVSRT